VVQLVILLNCQHQMGDVSGQLHVLAILPAEKFLLVPIQYEAERTQHDYERVCSI